MTITHHARFTAVPEVGHVLNGKTISGYSTDSFGKTDPATGEVLAQVPLGTARDVDTAVASCQAAFPAWRALPADRRRRVLLAIAEALRAHGEELGVLQSLEVGAVYGYDPSELPADFYEYYAGWVDKHAGHLVPSYPHAGHGYVSYEPVGVVASLLSWNGPTGACGLKVAAALAAGNCVVVKPSELGPISPVRFAEICYEAGVPEGVLNLVQGGPEVGKALVSHPGIAKITYTGGVEAGRQIMAAAGALGKRVVLELGGKSANIVFGDTDLASVIPTAAAFVTALSGQICLKPARMIVQRSVYEEVTSEVARLVRETRVGDPFAGGVTMGPVITKPARDRIVRTVEEAVGTGAGVLLAGDEPLEEGLDDGYFVRPAVFRDVDPASDLAQVECFGPVLAMMPFDDEQEAVRLANDTPYGLAAYVQTSDVGRAHRVAAALDAGYVGVNGMFNIRAAAPFGGVKGSGVGAEGGVEGMDEFLRRKHTEVFL